MRDWRASQTEEVAKGALAALSPAGGPAPGLCTEVVLDKMTGLAEEPGLTFTEFGLTWCERHGHLGWGGQ
jgi:hypothetical protein